MYTREWTHPRTGQTRRYIATEDWTQAAGFEIDHYKTGRVCYAAYKGEKFANGRAAALNLAKVWIDETGRVHVDNWGRSIDDVASRDEVTADIQAAWDAAQG